MPVKDADLKGLSEIILGDEKMKWVNEIKCLGVYLQSDINLLANFDVNCREFMRAFFGLLQLCGGLSEKVLRELDLKKCLPILLSGLDRIKVRSWQRPKVDDFFSNVIFVLENLDD